jgi:signal transduction histidine kinase
MSDPSTSSGQAPSAGSGRAASTGRVWYRSLYWRIAVGLTAFLAVMLVAQGLLFIWMTDRIAGSMPARSPRRLAVLVASDVGAALEREPQLDLQGYIRDQFGHVFRPIYVVMNDGRLVSNHPDPIPSPVQIRLKAQVSRTTARRRERGDGVPGPRRRSELAPIVAGGSVVGGVAVSLGRPPFSLLLRELGPIMGLIGGVVLIVGGAAIAVVVFGPARRRLRQLEEATERLGGGDLSARAPQEGGDEVAQLARSFNRMASELAARARALEASDRVRRQLLADVSHELMTPLTAMRGYLETLSMPEIALDDATRERYVGIVDEETRRLEKLVGDLLDLARLEGASPSFDRRRVDVASLFDRVAARHEREMQSRRIELVREVGAGAESVGGDPDRLEQALQNLAGNALRHTPDGGRVTLSAARAPDGVRIAVHDSGPGIPPEHLSRIFERFYKVDASRHSTGGSGLGLSIVKTIVERHGGTITARNEDGATFEMTLPG